MVEGESEKIYSFGYSAILITCILSVFIGKGNYVLFSLTRNDTIFAALIGFLLSFVTFFMIKYIISKNDEEDIYALNERIFGRVLGKAFNIALWIGFFIVGIVILYNMADFFNTEYLPETSVEYLKILVLLPLVYICTKNISTVIKMNQIFAVVSIILVLIGFLGIFPSFELRNFEPVLSSSKSDIIKSSITYFILSIVPLTALLVCSKKNIKDSDRLNGNLLKSFVFSHCILIAIIATTILTLGAEYLNIFRFPEYIALKQFSLFNILERIENILALQYYFNCVGLLSFLYYFMIKLIPPTKYKRYYSIVIALLQFITTKVIFKNTVTFIEMIERYFAYSVGIFIFLPLIFTFLKLILLNRKKMT